MSYVETQPPWIVHDRYNAYKICSGTLQWRPLGGHKYFWKVEITHFNLPFLSDVRADDENLMVLGSNREVHYTKSCNEEGSLIGRLEWKKGFFDLPVISSIYNLVIKHPYIYVPDGEYWSCSFIENGSYYLDSKGRFHGVGNGNGEIGETTTAFVSDTKNRLFRLYDPYIPKIPEDEDKIFLPFPETSKSYFELKGRASCRSGLFCIGYDVTKAEGEGVVKKLAGYFISADANLLGLNPSIKYTYGSERDSFALPVSLYRKVNLPEDVTSTVGVERSGGKGMTDLFLTIEGVQVASVSNGKIKKTAGFYSQVLGSDTWIFQEEPDHAIEAFSLLERKLDSPEEQFTPKVFDYDGFMLESRHPARLINFGKNSLKSIVEINKDGKKVEIALYPKESRWNILGVYRMDHTLVVPEEVLKILDWNEAVVPVRIDDGGQAIIIKRTDTGMTLFEFVKKSNP